VKNAKAKQSTLHQTILTELQERIVSGEWPPGFRLPFEVDLAEHYGCSRMTVNKVMTQLAKAGLIERRRKAGSFVIGPRAQSAVLELHDIETEVRSLGLPYAYSLIERRNRPSDAEDLRLMNVPEGTSIVELLAVHKAGGRLFCAEERRINASVVSEAENADFASDPPSSWLISRVPWSTAENRIQAVPASAEIARLLELPKGMACLVIERRTWNSIGPVTFVRLTYPGYSPTLVARFTPAQT
jgi:GntR family transcriptional regulator, histidine utilization repressor